MKIEDILVGTKARKRRDSRHNRIIQKDLYSVDPKKLSKKVTEADARIQHIEDLTIWDGSQGAKRAISTLRKLESNPQEATIKWDGSPAVIFGRNEKGQFVLTDKSGFGAVKYDGKVTSASDLEKMFLSRKEKPDATPEDRQNRRTFAGRMKNIWDTFEKATPEDFRGYVHGDLLYFDKPELIKGRLVFAPNTTTYYADPRSDIGKRIANSNTGVVLHAYIGLDGSKGKVDATKFISGELLVMPPLFVTHSPDVNVPELEQLEGMITKNANSIDDFLNVPAELKMKNLDDILYNYVNNKTKAGQLDSLGQDFMAWVEKSNKLTDSKKSRLIEYVNAKSQGLNAIFQIISGIMTVKNKIIAELDRQPADITATTGGNPGGEGYVVGGDVKLVNRNEFTRANMTKER